MFHEPEEDWATPKGLDRWYGLKCKYTHSMCASGDDECACRATKAAEAHKRKTGDYPAWARVSG